MPGKKTYDPIKELTEYGYGHLLKELAPCGETPERAYKYRTLVDINDPRCLMMVSFQGQVDVMAKMKNLGMLRPNK